MCMVEDADPPDSCASEFRRARKPHKCGECDREIELGERYERCAYVQYRGERPSHHLTCRHCVAARTWLQIECGGWCFGGVQMDLKEHADEVTEASKLDLCRRIIGMRRKSQKSAGASA